MFRCKIPVRVPIHCDKPGRDGEAARFRDGLWFICFSPGMASGWGWPKGEGSLAARPRAEMHPIR